MGFCLKLYMQLEINETHAHTCSSALAVEQNREFQAYGHQNTSAGQRYNWYSTQATERVAAMFLSQVWQWRGRLVDSNQNFQT